MKIPKKISPDRIKQSVIEIKYVSKFDFEIALGMFFNALDDTYAYTNRPVQVNLNNKITAVNFSDQAFPINGRSLFFNDKIKIEIQQNSISFNCLDNYLSWEVYLPEVKKVLGQLLNADVIQSFARVGLRYISHYPEIDLKDCVKFDFSFGMPDIKSNTYSFKTQFKIKDKTAFINLHNKLLIFDGNLENNQISATPTSIVDIDVLTDILEIDKDDIAQLVDKIESIHQVEKELFFTLLKEDFLVLLNPVY